MWVVTMAEACSQEVLTTTLLELYTSWVLDFIKAEDMGSHHYHPPEDPGTQPGHRQGPPRPRTSSSASPPGTGAAVRPAAFSFFFLFFSVNPPRLWPVLDDFSFLG